MSSATAGTAAGALRRIGTLLRLIRFSHTLFALPWALAGLFIGSAGWPEVRVLLLVAVAMAGARTAAMTFNRLVDRRFDAANPRTRDRPSVTGEVGAPAMAVAVVVSAAFFVAAAYALNPLCGGLSWAALVPLFGYSFCKRFTSLSHFVLGLCLGLAPLGAYLAARGSFDRGSLAAIALGAAVVLWTAGFDILYACQDVDHDRSMGLFSVPARMGVRGALIVARCCHALVPVALLAAHRLAGLGGVFLGAAGLVAVLLVYEHRLVRADDLTGVGRAFFQVNVTIGFVVMLGTLGDLLLEAGP